MDGTRRQSQLGKKVTFSIVSLDHDYYYYYYYYLFRYIAPLLSFSVAAFNLLPARSSHSLSLSLCLYLRPSPPLLPVFSSLSSFREILRSAQGRCREKGGKSGGNTTELLSLSLSSCFLSIFLPFLRFPFPLLSGPAVPSFLGQRHGKSGSTCRVG